MPPKNDDRVDLGSKLQEAFDDGVLEPGPLAKECGVSRQAIYGWLKTGRVDKKHLPVFARMSGKSLAWWLGADSELTSQYPTKGGESTFAAPAYNPLTGPGDNFIPGPDIRGRIPLISWVQAGHWSEVVKAFTEEDAEEWLPALRAMSRRAFAIRVEGQSMEPMFRHGEIIYVDPEVHAEHGKYVVVQLDDEPQATFKSLVIEGGHKFLRPLNPDWPGPKFIPINGNATIIGVVVGKWTPI
jgi:SOS-response transcriptional repressor LexA/predicted DNA-binding transcriptional regulator AlpA